MVLTPPSSIMKKTLALTLVELTVVIVIVGILGAVAIAGYNQYALKTRMTEAYYGINAITKSQIAYYVQHKRFRTVTANPYRVPRGGKKPIVASAPWSNIGTPLPVGTMTYFQYQARAGKNNAAGAPIHQNDSAGAYPIGDALMTYNFTTWALLDFPSFTACNRMTGNQIIPTAPNPHYSWTLINAVANFVEKIDNTGQWDDCSELRRIVDTDERGTVRSGAIQQINIGK